MVETNGYLVDEGKKGSGSGPPRPESVLEFRKGQRVLKNRKDEALQDLKSRGEKGDGTVGRGLVFGFVWFWDWKYV